MSLILTTLLGKASSKVAIYGGMVLAVLLILVGFYRAGARSEANATKARVLYRMRKDLGVKETIRNEVRTAGIGSPRASLDRLRRDWGR